MYTASSTDKNCTELPGKATPQILVFLDGFLDVDDYRRTKPALAYVVGNRLG